MEEIAFRLVDDRIRQNEEYALDLLGQLIACESTLGQEKGAQEVLVKHLEALGMAPQMKDVDLDVISRHPGFAPVEWSYEDRPLVYATMPGGGNGRSLILNGHIDVVPAGPMEYWKTDPWRSTVKDGRVYGRGAYDMKGGFVSAVLAMQAILSAGFVPDGRVDFQSVIEEECSGNGSLFAALDRPQADGALIFDTGPATVGHLGVMWFRVAIAGMATHAMESKIEANAIEKASVVIAALRELEREMNSEERPDEFRTAVNPIKLNVGTIRGGYWPSCAPTDCTVEFRLAFFPGTPVDTVQARVIEKLNAAFSEDPWLREHPPKVSFFGFRAEGSTVSPDSLLISVIREAHERGTKKPFVASYGTGCNDCRYFNLYADTNALVYGPLGGDMHAPNEFVEIESLYETARVIARFILMWCGFRKA